MPGVFVTATGTDIGKTYVTAGLIRAARRAGLAVDALKPILTGFGDGDLAASDAGVLLDALGEPINPETIDRLSPFRFAAPLAPSMAAPMESRRVDFEAVVASCRDRLQAERLLFVEGIGGVMVPLDETRTVLDLIAALDLPVLLVTGTALGALSHSLTAASVLRGRAVKIGALVLNESVDSTVSLSATRETLASFLPSVPTAAVPRGADASCFDNLLPLVRAMAHEIQHG